ncbi:MAG TPA: hypothetical protein VE129_06300 [Thermoanaerobaculia bacterium]|nr:hypothetical protein [Thermoanaerobaculia bacterium]
METTPAKLVLEVRFVASPLTRPARFFLPPAATDDQVHSAALGLVGLVWVVVVLASR